MKNPLCYIIILNYNGKQQNIIDDCLISVQRTSYPCKRYLFVDNGSTDTSCDYVRQTYPDVEILQHNENLGFAEGNNRGIGFALAKGAEYVTLLNNDTRVEPDWLSYLIDTAERNPKIGLCEAQQVTWDGKGLIQLKLKPDWMEGQRFIEPIQSEVIAPYPTSYAAGCCSLIRRETIEHIGVFDHRYFAYVEDVDLSFRAWLAGYDVYKAPASIVYHKGGVTMPSIRSMALGYRNQLFTLYKNLELSTLRRFSRSIFQRWVFTRNRYALLGTLALLRSINETLRQRREVQALRVRSDQAIFRLSGLE